MDTIALARKLAAADSLDLRWLDLTAPFEPSEDDVTTQERIATLAAIIVRRLRKEGIVLSAACMEHMVHVVTVAYSLGHCAPREERPGDAEQEEAIKYLVPMAMLDTIVV